MTQKEALAIVEIAERIDRYAENIEIEWDGIEELATYADIPLRAILKHTACDLLEIVTKAKPDEAPE